MNFQIIKCSLFLACLIPFQTSAQLSDKSLLTVITELAQGSVKSSCVVGRSDNGNTFGKKYAQVTITELFPSINSVWMMVAYKTENSFDFAYVNALSRKSNGMPNPMVICDQETWDAKHASSNIKFTKNAYRPGYWTDLDTVIIEMQK